MNRQLLVIALLQQLNAVHPAKLRIAELAVGCEQMGHGKHSAETLSGILTDLFSTQLVTCADDPFDASVTLYGRTETARVLLVKGGHIEG